MVYDVNKSQKNSGWIFASWIEKNEPVSIHINLDQRIDMTFGY